MIKKEILIFLFFSTYRGMAKDDINFFNLCLSRTQTWIVNQRKECVAYSQV